MKNYYLNCEPSKRNIIKKHLQKSKIDLHSGQKDDTIQLYKYSIELFLCEKRRFTITYPMEDKSYGTHARRRNG